MSDLITTVDKHLRSFKSYYTEFAWPTLKGGLEFRGSVYLIDCLTEYAEAFYKGEIRDLIVAIPPRNGKTTLFTVALHSWMWLKEPRLDLLSVSASDPLIRDFHVQRKSLYENPYYAAIWDKLHDCKLDIDSVELVRNTVGGSFHQWTHLTTRTGLGYNYGIFDDVIPVSQSRNLNYLEKVLDEFTRSSLSRRHNKKLSERSPTMIVQQRVAELDLAGCMKERGFHYLELQAIAEERQVFIMPLSGREWVRDVNDVLNPDLEDLESLLDIKAKNEGFQAQYQQRPLVTEGACIAADDLQYYTHHRDRSEYIQVHLTIDTAATIGARSANWGYVVLGERFTEEGAVYDVLYAFAHKFEYPAGKAKTLELIEEWEPNTVHIEAKSTGLSLIPELLLSYPGYDPLISGITPIGSKDDRSMAAIPLIKAKVIFPDALALPDTIWVSLLMYEVLGFPNAATNDLMDALTQFLNTLNNGIYASTFYGIN